ncbi:MAG: HAMP domain-containing histidine kinase [Peptococcaceae bacterium]|nr:HAMP domain-containing histidine kinase [Peptococcaceae bacterium]
MKSVVKMRYYGVGLVVLLGLGIGGILLWPGAPDMAPAPAEREESVDPSAVMETPGNTSEILSEGAEALAAYRRGLQAGMIVILSVMAGVCGLGFLALRQKILLLERERAAGQKNREMVAALSHDIQNPVASIQAVTELMEMTMDRSRRRKLNTIRQKTGQIHTLVSDLFNTTLEEVNTLSVNPVAFSGNRLADMIRRADYQGQARIGSIPDCLLWGDPVRLDQVFDNIMTNSYKYAGTAVDVSAEIAEKSLVLIFRDYGPGVGPEELPFLEKKYYRGKSADAKSGYGLGLFIVRSLVDHMGGQMACGNAQPGFLVKIRLPLAAD